jgi:HlyD family secretion protein
MVVQPHVPLRATTMTSATVVQATSRAPQGGRGGGGGGGNNNPNQPQRTGSTVILRISPEGSRVEKDEVVCVLDSASYRDELLAQQIRWDQAKSWVEQARSLLKSAEIALEEYRDGILPQDRHLLAGYLKQLRNDLAMKRLDLDYARGVARTGVMTPKQVQGVEYSVQQAEILYREAELMHSRLEKFTAPRLTKNLEAKVEGVRADLLAQEQAFALEDERKRRLERNIEHCTLRAPRDGIVIYAVPAASRRQADAQIQEGLPVRQGQEIFKMPDGRDMRLRAHINETRILQVHSGQVVEVRADAFPGVVLTGQVAEVMPIPAPANGPISDVKSYDAVIDINGGGLDGLRAGLSAEIRFAVDRRRDVVRIPIQAIRRVDDVPCVAVPVADGGYAWRRVEIGLADPIHAEVLAGLAPGDTVIADPETLPPPATLPPPPTRTTHTDDVAGR